MDVLLDPVNLTVLEHEITISGLILMGGGLFLLYKAVREIFNTTELHEEERGEVRRRTSVAGVIAQIVVISPQSRFTPQARRASHQSGTMRLWATGRRSRR